MDIHAESHIAHPHQHVYTTYRDRLSEVAAYIPDIKEIRVLSREDTDAQHTIHNLWIADREVPSMVKRFFSQDMLRWDDFAVWHDDGSYCDWRLSIPAFPNQVRCSGQNHFHADGSGTKVVLTGDLQIAVDKIPGIPKILARRIAPQLEKFIVQLIKPNLIEVNRSLGRFLDAQG